VGAASSSILLEIYLQYSEHTNTVDIPAKHQISRYVNDVLFIYHVFSTNIKQSTWRFLMVFAGNRIL